MSRKAFESEARKHGFILDRLDKSGVYVQLITEQAWLMWKAATDAALERAAVACDGIKADYTARYSETRVRATMPGNLEFLDGASDGAEECAEAIRALKDAE